MALVSFLYPKFLLLLFLVPFFVFVYFLSILYKGKRAVIFANFEAIERFYDVEFFSKNFISLYVNIAIICLIVFALAGTNVNFDANTSTYSYVLLIDNSLSMKTSDILPNRLEAAKISADNFIDLLPPGVEVGVISFSGDAIIMQEMTSLKYKLKESVNAIDFGVIQGTNIYNALLSANRVLGDAPRKAVILISDGQLNVGSASQIVQYANQKNIVVDTLAIGTVEGGQTDSDTLSKLDEDFLKSLAFETQGNFFSVSDNSDFDESFNKILYDTNKNVSLDISFYLLLAAILLFCLSWIADNFKFRITS